MGPNFQNVSGSSVAKNFYPVRLLLVLSKSIDKTVHNGLADDLRKCGLFFYLQYSFSSSSFLHLYRIELLELL